MPPVITALYAGINALIVLALVAVVIRQRQRAGVGIGSGGDARLERAIHMHGNAVENVPLALVLLLILELGGVGRPILHGIGASLAVGRVLHAWGLWHAAGNSLGRSLGMALTWLALIAGLVGTLTLGLRAL